MPLDESLAECHRTMGPMVLAYVSRLVGPVDAEDVTQQVFLEVWRTRDRYDPTRRLEPWLLGIARKRAIDHLRRRSRAGRDVEAAMRAAETMDAEQFADRYAAVAAVREALTELSDLEREAIVLAYVGQLSQTEIAERLGVPLGTVKARVFRGLRHLAAALIDDEDDR